MNLPYENVMLEDLIILFDRDLGLSIYQNFRGYNNLLDDAEWLLERTSKKSWGFLIRPVSNGKQDGIWIGEYTYNGNNIVREELIFDNDTSEISRVMMNLANSRIDEEKFVKNLSIDLLRNKIDSKIIRDFKYYLCPIEKFYYSCPHILKIYKNLKQKFSEKNKILYTNVSNPWIALCSGRSNF